MAIQFFQIQPESSISLSTWISAATLILGVSGAIVAWRSFRRAEDWKQAEFLASQIKQLFDDPQVKNALLMIDWGTRPIRLLDPSGPKGGEVMVTRELQVQALRPHEIVDRREAGDRRFGPEGEAIRDCYDALLNGLERLNAQIDNKLMTRQKLWPYLCYWIEDIHNSIMNPGDHLWAWMMITYIGYYRYSGVLSLLATFGGPIDHDSPLYKGLLNTKEVKDSPLVQQIEELKWWKERPGDPPLNIQELRQYKERYFPATARRRSERR
jgi:hypothetical protein